MARHRVVQFMMAMGLLAMLAACMPGAKLTNAWLSETYSGPPFTKIMVLGTGADGAVRRIFEDSFAAALTRPGMQAFPGYTLLPGDEPPTPDRLRQAAQRVGADAALVTRLVRVEQKTETSPGYVRTMPGWGYRGGFYGYYGHYGRVAYVEPPRTTTYNVAELQTDFWSLRGDDGLVWSGTSQAVSPTDIAKVGGDLAKEVAEELTAGGLIPPAPSGS